MPTNDPETPSRKKIKLTRPSIGRKIYFSYISPMIMRKNSGKFEKMPFLGHFVTVSCRSEPTLAALGAIHF